MLGVAKKKKMKLIWQNFTEQQTAQFPFPIPFSSLLVTSKY